MADLSTFRTFHDESADKKYPKDKSKLRSAQAEYARNLIAGLREARGDILAATKSEGEYRKFGEAASETTMGQIFSAFDKVERFMDRQQERADEGEKVKLLEGSGRHLLSNALGDLFFEMKDFYAAKDKGLVSDTGEIILPESEKVADVADQGPAMVELFLTKVSA